jgi:hypothetical protein
MPDIDRLQAGVKYFNEDGTATLPLLVWADAVADLSPIDGVGSPEGVIEANRLRKYIDNAGVAGAIEYIKRDVDDGAGDKRFGWVLI